MTANLFTKSTLALAIGAAVLVAGCETPMSERQKGTAVGAGVGAVAGGAIGAATGGKAGTGAAIGAVVGAVGGNLWSKHLEDKRKAMAESTKGTGIEVTRTPQEELKVNVPSDFSFDVGRADIKPQMQPVLNQFAQGLDPKMKVRIVGHTDSTGSDAINNPLSVSRAQAVRNYLSGRGVPAAQMTTDGMGASNPVADNNSDSGRARNRRVEIFLSEPAA